MVPNRETLWTCTSAARIVTSATTVDFCHIIHRATGLAGIVLADSKFRRKGSVMRPLRRIVLGSLAALLLTGSTPTLTPAADAEPQRMLLQDYKLFEPAGLFPQLLLMGFS